MTKRLAIKETTVSERDRKVTAAFDTMVMAFAATRRYMAIKSIFFFSWYYCGILLTRHQLKWIRTLVATRRAALICPFDHGKTECVSRILILWLIARDRNVRILLTAASEGLAVKNALVIREELESNSRLINDFGKFYSRDKRVCRIWQQRIFQVIRSKNLKDATVEAIGIGGAITGGRFDFIIGDDVVDVRNAQSATQRRKIEEDVVRTIVTRAGRHGFVWFIGTRKHADDLYNYFDESPTWTVIHDKGIIREPEDWEIIKRKIPIELEDGSLIEHEAVIHSEDHGECLWPEERPMEYLLLLRFQMGERRFNMEVQGVVTDDSSAFIARRFLEQCRDQSLTFVTGDIPDNIASKYERVVCGTDPSLPITKEDADNRDTAYMVQVALGLTKEGRIDLIGFERERGHTTAQAQDKVENFFNRFKPRYHLVEANSFGLIYTRNLIEERGVKISKHMTGLNKSDPLIGIQMLEVLFENRQIALPYATEEDQRITQMIIEEIYQYPDRPTDIPMALWIGCTAVERHQIGQRKLRKRQTRPSRQRRKVA